MSCCCLTISRFYWLWKISSSTDADTLQTQEAIQRIKAKNPNFRFLITQPKPGKPGYDASFPGHRWGRPPMGNARPSAQFQTEWVSDLRCCAVDSRPAKRQAGAGYFEALRFCLAVQVVRAVCESVAGDQDECAESGIDSVLNWIPREFCAVASKASKGVKSPKNGYAILRPFGPPIGPPPKLPAVISA